MREVLWLAAMLFIVAGASPIDDTKSRTVSTLEPSRAVRTSIPDDASRRVTNQTLDLELKSDGAQTSNEELILDDWFRLENGSWARHRSQPGPGWHQTSNGTWARNVTEAREIYKQRATVLERYQERDLSQLVDRDASHTEATGSNLLEGVAYVFDESTENGVVEIHDRYQKDPFGIARGFKPRSLLRPKAKVIPVPAGSINSAVVSSQEAPSAPEKSVQLATTVPGDITGTILDTKASPKFVAKVDGMIDYLDTAAKSREGKSLTDRIWGKILATVGSVQPVTQEVPVQSNDSTPPNWPSQTSLPSTSPLPSSAPTFSPWPSNSPVPSPSPSNEPVPMEIDVNDFLPEQIEATRSERRLSSSAASGEYGTSSSTGLAAGNQWTDDKSPSDNSEPQSQKSEESSWNSSNKFSSSSNETPFESSTTSSAGGSRYFLTGSSEDVSSNYNPAYSEDYGTDSRGRSSYISQGSSSMSSGTSQTYYLLKGDPRAA